MVKITNVAVASSLILMAAGASAFAAPHGEREGWFDRLDANDDGVITEAEMDTHHSSFFQEADSNGDSAVTKEELSNYAKARRAQRRAERNPDKNNDGIVDRDEFMSAAEKRFQMLDKNNDGVLSEDEHKRRRGHR